MAKIVRDFKFPGSSDSYRVNAEYLDGLDSSKFALHEEGTHIIKNCAGTTDSDAKTSTWTGTSDCISEYTDGLRISYKIPEVGQTTTTLNINNLGAKTIYRFGTSKLTTHFAVNQIITLIYCADLNGGCWVTNDYDANTDTKLKVYKTSTDKDYPVIFRYDNTNSSSSYTEYGRYDDDLTYTYNPSSNTLKVGNVTASGKVKAPSFEGSMSGTLTIGNQSYNGSSSITVTAADLGITGALVFLGTTTTAISDGSTTKTITVNSKSVTAIAGNVVLYGGYEFVWTGSAWEQLGQEGSFSLKTHTHEVPAHTPSGTISTPTITVTPNTTTVNSITGVGTLPVLTYQEKTASKITNWSAGTLPTASLSGGTASLTISEDVSAGPNRHVKVNHTLSHSNPTLTFSGGTLPSLTYEDVKADDITEWSPGTLPTKGSNTTVVTSIKSATSSQPTFTGTAVPAATTSAAST